MVFPRLFADLQRGGLGLSLLFWHGLPQDVDFRGGTVVRVKFDQQPNVDHIRAAADKAGLKDVRIQSITEGQSGGNEVIIFRWRKMRASLDEGGAATILQTHEAYTANSGAGPGKTVWTTWGRTRWRNGWRRRSGAPGR